MLSLAILAICIICILIYIYVYKPKKEPFANSVVVSNLYENPDEIFLLATNPASFKINAPSDSFDYNGTGIPYVDALAACEAVGPGVTLADYSTIATSKSGLSLLTALDLSANWCAAGWVKGDSNYAYFPMSDFKKYKCKLNDSSNGTTSLTPTQGKFYLSTSKGIGKYNPGVNGKAFAICVGPKPAEANLVAKINYFNNTSYSMYTLNMMNMLKTGVDENNPYNLDIFPIEFTDAQAYTALEKNSYNVKNARDWLKTGYNTAATSSTDPINSVLNPNSESAAKAAEWASNSVQQSCLALSTVYTNMDTSLSTLKGVFHDLSGIVMNTITAKGQNAILQSVIGNICSTNPQGIVTKACGRLLSLDYDLFYRNNNIDPNKQTNYITALETINRSLFEREVEIQQSLGSLQQILNTLIISNSDTSQCVITRSTLKGKYGNNMIAHWSTGVLQPIDSSTYFSTNVNGSTITVSDSTAIGRAPSNAFNVGRDIEMNGVERLKVNLEEISPFFNAADYTSLVSDVLNQLSITLRTPLAKEYSNVESIANITNKHLGIIASNIANL